MNYKFSVLIGFLSVVVLVVGIGKIMKKALPLTPVKQKPAVMAANVMKNKEGITQGTITKLMAEGKSVKCNIINSSASANLKGVLFASSLKVKGDFSTTTPVTTVNSHIIIDPRSVYVWTDVNNQGFTFPVSQMNSTNALTNAIPDIHQTYSFSCQNWNEDDSLFVVPHQITFLHYPAPSEVQITTTTQPITPAKFSR